MTEKKFFVKWGGTQREIIFDSDIPYGRFMEVVRSAGNFDAILRNDLDINVDIFARELLRATVISPKEFTDSEELAKIPTSVMLDVIEHVMAEYQLMGFLKRVLVMLGMMPKDEKLRAKGRSSK